MDVLLLIVGSFVGFLVAYHTYGRWLARKIFRLDDTAPVPSRELEDGVDYVPSRKGIIFGHHYTSIAGTGPIVGPAIGIIWGWVPAVIWVVVGSIFMGAVHDFGAMVISLRNQGKSLSEVTARYINPRVRTIFFAIVFLELLIVIAIFALVIAILFMLYPQSVIPIWMELPIAIALGWIIHRKGGNVPLFTALAVLTMYGTVVAGYYLPADLAPLAGWVGMAVTGLWAIILLAYAYVASTLPVTTLLQPRDYINAWQLFIVMALLTAGALASAGTGQVHIVADAFNRAPAGAPPIWPFLFVTIACGAISGFHCLVASGTTSKEISSESHVQFVGYGSMLLEGALAILVIVAVAGGIGMAYQPKDGPLLTGQAAWQAHYASWGVSSGLPAKVQAVVVGSANMMATIGLPKGLGLVILGVFIASFAGTTLDTATRIQRYAIGELGTSFRMPRLGNRFVATALAVLTAAGLAFATGADGKGALALWPMFGAVNQLLAALALLAISIYLRRKHARPYYLVSFLPFVFMIVMTLWAVVANEFTFVGKALAGQQIAQHVVLSVINAITLLLAIWMTVESSIVLARTRSRAPVLEEVAV